MKPGVTYNLNSPIVQGKLARGEFTPEQLATSNFVYGNSPTITTETIPVVEAGDQPPLLVSSSPVITRINPVGAPPVYPDLPTTYQGPMPAQSPTVQNLNQQQYASPMNMAQQQSQQPYPDPYGLITNIGLANYQLPTFNFTGALGGNPPATAGYIVAPPVPGYMDYRQPVQGMPIQNYYNPYIQPGYMQPPVNSFSTVGYVNGYGPAYYGMPSTLAYGAGWSPFGAFGIQPTEDDKKRMMRYQYGTDEDRRAIDEGFDSAIHSQINNLHITTMMNKAVAKTQEEKDRIQATADEYEEYLREIDKKEQDRCNPYCLTNYNREEEKPFKIHVKIVKGDEVLVERGADETPRRLTLTTQELTRGVNLNDIREQFIANHYNNAPERQLDHMSIIKFFNEGWGILREAELRNEFAMLEAKNMNVTRLYDPEEFRISFYKYHGSPQQRQKVYEMEQNMLAIASMPKTLEQLSVGPEYWGRPPEPKSEDYLPQPGEPGFDPYDPRHTLKRGEDGKIIFSPPDWIMQGTDPIPGVIDTIGLSPEQMADVHENSAEYQERLKKWMIAVDNM